jgi:sugar lactone lactonase YvrE
MELNAQPKGRPNGIAMSPDGKILASSGKFVGDGERQRAISVRNRRSFRQVESKDLC